MLEKRGIIQGYKAVIDPTKVPEGLKFIVDLDVPFIQKIRRSVSNGKVIMTAPGSIPKIV